jgi:hypothetical protein
MKFRSSIGFLGIAAFGLSVWLSPAAACESDHMKVTDAGFIFKVVGGSDKVEAKKEPGSSDTAFVLDLLQPYFVICDEGDTYKITDLQAQSVAEAEKGKVGYVLKSQVYPWPTREALNFSPLIRGADRPEIMAWDSEKVFDKFLDTLDATANPPAFRENRETTLKREHSIRPYPVLSSADKTVAGGKDKRVFDVLLPAVLPPDAKLVCKTKDCGAQIKDTLTSGTFAIAFDVTSSMGPFAEQVAKDINAAFEGLPAEVQDKTKIGFVFFRDKEDSEKIVISDPLPVKAATDALHEIATKTSGGGDAAEPVLDATYVAGLLFPWDKAGQGTGKRVVISVLGDDAKPATEGAIDSRVPVGLDATSVADELLKQNIEVISVQASDNAGPNLQTVLSTLATQTGGEFIGSGAGRSDKIASAVGSALANERKTSFKEGETIASKITMYNGYPSIPMEVLDGTKLDDLRKAGIDFNIESSKGGVLVREGYMLENQDLLEEQIEVEKDTVQKLVKLFSALGVSGVDADAMKQSAGQAIAAIAGEDFDAKEPISEIVKKKLGIQFRTKLLDFDLEYLASMNPAERAGMAKRVQDAGDKLNNFLQAHLEEFDKTPAVWMPVDVLP